MNTDSTKSLFLNFLPVYLGEISPISTYICEIYKTGAGGVLVNKS